MKNNKLFIFTVLFISSLLLGCRDTQSQDILDADVADQIVEPQQYVIYSATKPIVIDGKANEQDWNQAPFTSYFIDIEGRKKPKFDTRVKMLWDDEHLFVYAELTEPHISANLTKHDTVIFYDNDFEVFIDPTDDTYRYVEIEINALNTTWELYLDRPYRSGGKALNAFELEGFKSAIGLLGTLNNPNDIDSMWTVEMAIPINVIMEVAKKGQREILDGDIWRMNFSRVHWDQQFENGQYRRLRDADGNLLKEYNWVWSNQKVINMHQPEKWGYVQFSKNSTDKPVDFISPSDNLDKQVAYALFRNTRRKDWKYLRSKLPGFTATIESKEIMGYTYHAQYVKTHGGFEIITKNTTTGISYVINDIGYLTKLK